MNNAPDFLTTADIQARLGFTTPDGTLDFLHRHRLAGLRIGRRLLWRTTDIEQLLTKLDKGVSAQP